MDICKNCGAIIQDGVKFCPSCGTKNDLADFSSAGMQIKQEGYIPKSWIEDTGASNANANPGVNYQGAADRYSGTYQNSYTPPVSPDPPQGGKKKKPAIFVFGFIAALVILLVCILAFGGSEDSSDPNLGRYECISCMAMDIELGGEGDWLELKSGGKVTVCLDGEEYNGKWTLEGNKITITQSGDTFEGTLSNGIAVLDFNDLICTYAKDGAKLPEASAPAVEEIGVDLQWWQGDWYGWWIMNNTTGEYTDLEDSCWDTCAVIDLDSTGEGSIELWDTDNEPGLYFAICDIEIVDGDSELGKLISVDGSMYDGDIEYYDWSFDPATSYVSEYDHMLCIEGKYYDPDNSANSFEYFIFLRPWGTYWEDVRNDPENPNMPYTDMMPVHYDDWYMEHVNGAMPASFN